VYADGKEHLEDYNFIAQIQIGLPLSSSSPHIDVKQLLIEFPEDCLNCLFMLFDDQSNSICQSVIPLEQFHHSSHIEAACSDSNGQIITSNNEPAYLAIDLIKSITPS
jgi:hypothetical protein